MSECWTKILKEFTFFFNISCSVVFLDKSKCDISVSDSTYGEEKSNGIIEYVAEDEGSAIVEHGGGFIFAYTNYNIIIIDTQVIARDTRR